MDVADLVDVLLEVVAERSLVVLHMVGVKEDHEVRRADQARDFCGHLRRLQEVADMVDLDVECFKVHANLVLFCQLDALRQRAVHGAELHRIGEFIVMVDDDAAIAQCIGVDGDRLGADRLSCLQRSLEGIEVGSLLLGVYERKVIVAIEAADGDASRLGCRTDLLEVADAPIPELDRLKAIFLGRGKALFKRKFCIECIDAGTAFHEIFLLFPDFSIFPVIPV